MTDADLSRLLLDIADSLESRNAEATAGVVRIAARRLRESAQRLAAPRQVTALAPAADADGAAAP